MNKIFSLVEKTSEQVTIKVNAKDLLVIAKHPYVSEDMEYITVTRGGNHILTIIYTDGHTWSFHWGTNGHTLIGENTERLRKEVIKFIENDCGILLEWDDGSIDEAVIFYNKNYNKWQLTLRGDRKNGSRISAMVWDSLSDSVYDMMKFAKKFVVCEDWTKSIAATGIDVWYAIL